VIGSLTVNVGYIEIVSPANGVPDAVTVVIAPLDIPVTNSVQSLSGVIPSRLFPAIIILFPIA